MVAQLPDNSWSKLLTFVLSSKQECAEYGIRSDHRRYESVPTIASNAAHLVFSFSRRSVSLPSVTSLPLEWLRPILPQLPTTRLMFLLCGATMRSPPPWMSPSRSHESDGHDSKSHDSVSSTVAPEGALQPSAVASRHARRVGVWFSRCAQPPAGMATAYTY